MESIGLVLLVLVAGHFLNAFIIWFTHLLLHQRILGIPLYRIHLGAHHRIDYVDDYVLDVSSVIEHFTWAGFTVLVSSIYLLVFPFWIAVIFVVELLLSIAWSYYLHMEYENPDSRLARFKWYQYGLALHKLHHGYRPEADAGTGRHEAFHRSVNYSFGGPVLGALMDRLFGTYLGADARIENKQTTAT
jgi:sterol desaturase/sphingolipid hydroxylase (fatty acid hydroxylase superfamily)